MATKYEAATAAAKWWAEVIYMGKNTDELQVCFFNELLEDRISNELDEAPLLELESNYRPCKILAEVAEEVAIDESLFNFECIMIITRNRVLIKDSDNPWLELFPINEMI